MTNVQQHIGSIALVVKDYDDAIEFYTQKLNFELVEDTDLGDDKRWVLISPPNSNGANSNETNSNGTNSSRTSLLLAKATTPEQMSAIGNQTGGRVFLFLHTNDFWRDYNLMLSKSVTFNEEPRVEPYGTVVVFEDLYGTKWDLLQLNN
ncbi:VOC family protein [Pseudoalteromonas sp. TAE56]|uniref:VOC family protein n=1 Tax=Pseudoalteromonas sp. TAE56 TaxID=1938596 RepID=UPI00040B7C6B|nr:VOC family protein [Pseudoalteromonas sp. TAE56]